MFVVVHVCHKIERKMANNILVVFAAVILLQIGTGKDIHWIRNSNWNNVDNWSLGRLPCKGDIVSFSQVTPLRGQNPVIYFNANSTVRRLVLPRNGKIVLKRSITIKLTPDESCEISSNTVPMAAAGGGEVNNFIGVRDNKWECPENWAADDNSFITHAPCGSDVPVFPSDSAFSYITSAMGSIFVNNVSVRADKPPNFDSHSNELLLNLSFNPNCQNNPELCPCIQVDNNCSVLASSTSSLSSMSSTTTGSFATTPQPSASSSASSMAPSLSLFTPGNVDATSSTSVPPPFTSGPVGPITSAGVTNNNDDGGSIAPAVIGAIVGVVVVLLIVLIIVIVIVVIVKKRRYRETKHTHLEEDDHAHAFAAKESGTAAYDNPVYECNLSIHSTDQNPLF